LIGASAALRARVQARAEEWTQYANIHFAFVDQGPAAVRVGFEQNGQSWSLIGRNALGDGNSTTMNLGWLTDNTDDVEVGRVVLHEFGHVLGLVHEQSSPAASIPWDKEKAYAYFAKLDGWDRATVDGNVFMKYAAAQTNYSHFDPASIMEYFIPAFLTTNNVAIPGNTTLSDTDKSYISAWYPRATNASGQLRTGDDCDQIDFRVEPGAVPPDRVAFDLQSANGITWWKAIDVPVNGGGSARLEVWDKRTDAREIAITDIDPRRPVRFSKAKFLGIHTLLGYTWPVLPALQGGSRVTLTWTRDHC
jgi:hypothetical protein